MLRNLGLGWEELKCNSKSTVDGRKMPLVRLGSHSCNPLSEPHVGWTDKIVAFRAGMLWLRTATSMRHNPDLASLLQLAFHPSASVND